MHHIYIIIHEIFRHFFNSVGIAMFIIGAGAFASQGEMNFILANFGEFSFKFWLPIIIIGGIVLVLSDKKK